MMKQLPHLLAIAMLGAACLASFATRASELTPEQRALHVLNRLAYGPKPGDVARVTAEGIAHYIDAQLHPETIPLPAALTQRLDALPMANAPAAEAVAQYREMLRLGKLDTPEASQQRRELSQRMNEQTAEARLIRAIDSPRQLQEVMVDFWFNHFNVYIGKGVDRALIAGYERDAIRPHALGKFRDLLGATAKHPAMLFYLDNWLSAAPGFWGRDARANGLNENCARELMELHTLGVDGGYTQQDVTELARMLTGWTFNEGAMLRGGPDFRFDARRHDEGVKQWLGHQVAPRGQEEGEWALDVLATHPATARHISYLLAQYFVADVPPRSLVERMTRRFEETDGDIRAVLRTLFDSPEFWQPAHVDNKFKTPYRFVISAIRAAGVPVSNTRPLPGVLSRLGMPLYGCQTPDGYKNTEESWLNPDALTRRITFATTLASGRVPLSETNDPPAAVDASTLLATLGGAISPRVRDSVADSTPALQSALILGSPDFMRH
jgi:uncharacterized protein (DUF1800 family)